MTSVLVVDDEPHLLRALVLNLSTRGYRVSSAATGAGALATADAVAPDIVILDLGLPDIDGMDVIERIRARQPDTSIIVLSARTGSKDKVAALDLGAVDYVTKPFDVNELIARVRAASRRAGTGAVAVGPIEVGEFVVDLDARTVTRPGAAGEDRIRLTPTEWRMLDVLVRNPGRLVTGPELLTAMRGGADNTEASYLRIYMQQLRRKLEAEPSRPRHLLTEPGMGYRFQP
jgi:two-component system KDP operon response regulator KdpE